jgi:hypothetical protein
VGHREALGSDPGDDLHSTQGQRRRALSQVEKTGLHHAIQLMWLRFDLLRTDSWGRNSDHWVVCARTRLDLHPSFRRWDLGRPSGVQRRRLDRTYLKFAS